MHPQNCTGDLVAQLVEQYTFNVWALGSSPSGITKTKNLTNVRFFFARHTQFYGLESVLIKTEPLLVLVIITLELGEFTKLFNASI